MTEERYILIVKPQEIIAEFYTDGADGKPTVYRRKYEYGTWGDTQFQFALDHTVEVLVMLRKERPAFRVSMGCEREDATTAEKLPDIGAWIVEQVLAQESLKVLN